MDAFALTVIFDAIAKTPKDPNTLLKILLLTIIINPSFINKLYYYNFFIGLTFN
ncbi:hypothetical protein AKFMO35_11390 [Apilactobacillus kunkeei]